MTKLNTKLLKNLEEKKDLTENDYAIFSTPGGTKKVAIGKKINEIKTSLDNISTDLKGHLDNHPDSTNADTVDGKHISDPMTQAEYDELEASGQINPNTLYIVTDSNEIIGLPNYNIETANKILAVKGDGTGVEWIEKPTGNGGSISGYGKSLSINGSQLSLKDENQNILNTVVIPTGSGDSINNIIMGISILNYPRIDPESNDSPRIQRAFDENPNEVIYFPMGEYEINQTITGLNISMECHPRAVFNGTGTGSLFELRYEGEFSESFNGNYQWRHFFINKGQFNGNDVMDGIKTYDGHNIVFKDCLFVNCKSKGLWIATGTSTSKYYIHNCTARGTTTGSLSNTAFYVEGSDHHFVDCTVADYTKAFYAGGGGAHRFARCHHWITQQTRYSQSKAFEVRGGGCTFLDCYLDTVKIGFDMYSDLQTFNCAGFSNPKYALTGTVYYNMNVYNRNIIINGGNFNDIYGNFWGGYTPNDQTIIQNINGTCKGIMLPIKTYNSTASLISNSVAVKGYNFLTLDLNSPNTCNFKFDINVVNSETDFGIKVKAIKTANSCRFKYYGDSEISDRIKVVKESTMKYKFIYVPIDENDSLIFRQSEPIGFSRNSDLTYLGVAYLHSVGIINTYGTGGTIYENDITSNLVNSNTEDVTSFGGGNISVTGITLNKTTTSIVQGSTELLTATISPADATNKSISWTSSNTSAATVNNGLISAVGVGNSTITATTSDGGKTATCAVTVTSSNVGVTGVTLNKSTTTINVSSTDTLIETIAPSNATNKTVTWSTSDANIATVSNGIVTGVANGNCTITCTSVSDNTKSATCTVTVQTSNIAVTGVSVSPTTASISTIGGTQQLTATILPSNATNKNVTWNSSNTGIATVDSTGKVTSVAEGSATITCTSAADGTKTATCSVTVTQQSGGAGNDEASFLSNFAQAFCLVSTNSAYYTFEAPSTIYCHSTSGDGRGAADLPISNLKPNTSYTLTLQGSSTSKPTGSMWNGDAVWNKGITTSDTEGHSVTAFTTNASGGIKLKLGTIPLKGKFTAILAKS